MTFSPGRRFGAESVVLVSSSGVTLIFFKQMAPVSNQEKDADSGDYGEFVFEGFDSFFYYLSRVNHIRARECVR